MDDKASTEAISRMLLGIVEAIVDKPEETEIVTLDIDGGTCFGSGWRVEISVR